MAVVKKLIVSHRDERFSLLRSPSTIKGRCHLQPLHHRIHLTFPQKLYSVTSPPSQVTENSCKWVPATTQKDENGTLA